MDLEIMNGKETQIYNDKLNYIYFTPCFAEKKIQYKTWIKLT